MQRWCVSLLVVVIFVSGCGFAQESPNNATEHIKRNHFSKRAVNLTGRISDDGNFLIVDPDQSVWTVANPDATKPYARRKMTVLAQTDAEASEVRVLSAMPENDRPPSVTRWADSAFRR